jgi:hypothetical protein
MKKRQTTIYTIVIIYFFNIGIMLNIKTWLRIVFLWLIKT